MSHARRGFTLVELLVVITIIAMLAALILPAVQMAREAGRRATCINNQKNCGLAVLGYESAKQKMPPSYVPYAVISSNATYVGWVHNLLPYLERNDLAALLQTTPPTLHTTPTKMQVLICPSGNTSSTAAAPISYVVNCGRQDKLPTGSAPYPSLDWQENGVFFSTITKVNSITPIQPVTTSMSYITRNDGAGNTLMLSENQNTVSSRTAADTNRPDTNWTGYGNIDNKWSSSESPEWEMGLIWAPPPTSGTPPLKINEEVDPLSALDNKYARPSSGHPGLVVATFCDGSVKTLSNEVEPRVYALLMTPKGTAAKEPFTGTLTKDPSISPTYQTWLNTPLSDDDIAK